MAANRRKLSETLVAISSTSTSDGTAASGAAANADKVTFFIALTTLTAGSVVFKIQISANDGVTWHDLSTSEMTGDTGSITATGNYHVSSAAPIGTMARLYYTITTGPIAGVVYPVYEKSGSVY